MDKNNVPGKKNRVLVLQSYGGLGAYEAGAFITIFDILSKKDEESGHQRPLFDTVIGCSMGAINAAIIISHVKATGNWNGSSEKLIKFWESLSVSTEGIMPPDFSAQWEILRKANPNIASTEAAVHYYSAKSFLSRGVPNVFSSPSPRLDNKYLNPSNVRYCYDKGPLKKSIERFVQFPLATSFDKGEPRLF